MKTIVNQKKSIIPSCDTTSIQFLEKIVRQTHKLEKISAFKIGFELAICHGLKKTVSVIKKITDKPIIYDHQKAGNDIPEMGERFALACRQAKINAVIIFPFTGPKSENAWIQAIQAQQIGLIVGANMTHENFLASENGFIEDNAPKKILEIAAKKKISNYVMPANKLEQTLEFKKLLEKQQIKPVFFLPGLIAQGGTIEQTKKALKTNFHAIIGRGLYESKNIRETAAKLCEQI